MAGNYSNSFYDSRSSDGDDEEGYRDKHDRHQRNRNSRRALERRLELKALNDMLGDYEEYDLD